MGILLIFKLFVPDSVNTETIIDSVFPITFSQYWFASAYLGMYLLSPFLNSIIRGLSCKRYLQLLIGIMVVLAFVQPVSNSPIVSGNVSWFVFLYLIAGFIRKYPMPLFEKKGIYFLGFGVTYFTLYLLSLALTYLGIDISDFSKLTSPLISMNSMPIFVCSLFLFLGFKNIRLGSRRWINVIAATTFGIYLIHDNNIVRNYLWTKVFQTPQNTGSALLIPFSVLIVATIFLAGSAIDLLRETLVENPLFG